MSFILDALKKSESERQRQAVPGLIDSGRIRERARLPGWALALAVLLAANLLILGWVLTRSWRTSAPVSPVSEPPAAERTDSQDTADHFSPLEKASAVPPPVATTASPVPVYAPEIPVSGAAPNPTPRPIRRHPELTPEPDAANEEVLPTIREVSLPGSQAMPDLHLDVHVFAAKATERFVYVNMHKYHEGATLQEGPTVERIRRDGVVLAYRGLRFLLPRQ